MDKKESDRSGRSDGSERSTRPRRLRPSGGYRELRSFQVATVIYDATVSFCDRFVDKRSRTHDQMVQAARSGRQNIAEGSRAAATSSQTELRLVNVARASLDELLLDFEDYLRQRGLKQWGKDDPVARRVREMGFRRGRSGGADQTDRSDRTDQSDHKKDYSEWLDHRDPAVVANAVLCLIHQANYLLDQQIAGLEREFISEGGYSEQLVAARLEERRRQSGGRGRTDLSNPTDRTDRTEQPPACPDCGNAMVLRTARQGKLSGSRFWGCRGYPECRGTREWGSDGSVGSGRSDGSRRKESP